MAEQIDPALDRQIRKLAEQQTQTSQADIQGYGREWMIGDQGDWSGDPNDIPNLGLGFDRAAIIEAYTKSIANPETIKTGELSNLRLQYETSMSGERAFRLRHATMLRGEFFASARRKGLGDGGLAKITVEYLQSLLKAAQS